MSGTCPAHAAHGVPHPMCPYCTEAGIAADRDFLPAIRSVLAAYRSTKAHITREQIEAAWREYDELREAHPGRGTADG